MSLGFICLNASEDFRNWQNEKGEVIEAKFIKFSKDKVEIKRKDGITFTVSPSTFIKEDQDYLAALRKRVDSRGYLWDASSTKFEISYDEWTDAPIGTKGSYFYTFRSERVDLDMDGTYDGKAVHMKWVTQKNFKSMAWDVASDGTLIFKRKLSTSTIHLGKYKYDIENKTFLKIEGYGPKLFRRSGR